MLSQIYFLISADKRVDVSTLSRNFAREVSRLTGTYFLWLINGPSQPLLPQGNGCQRQL
jgi:hypothetical protein